MKRSRFSEAQIIDILKEHQAGLSAPVNAIVRNAVVSLAAERVPTDCGGVH